MTGYSSHTHSDLGVIDEITPFYPKIKKYDSWPSGKIFIPKKLKPWGSQYALCG